MSSWINFINAGAFQLMLWAANNIAQALRKPLALDPEGEVPMETRQELKVNKSHEEKK